MYMYEILSTENGRWAHQVHHSREKINYFFRGLLFEPTCPNFLHCTTVQSGPYESFRGSFLVFQGSFWNFGGKFALSPRVFFFPLHHNVENQCCLISVVKNSYLPFIMTRNLLKLVLTCSSYFLLLLEQTLCGWTFPLINL